MYMYLQVGHHDLTITNQQWSWLGGDHVHHDCVFRRVNLRHIEKIYWGAEMDIVQNWISFELDENSVHNLYGDIWIVKVIIIDTNYPSAGQTFSCLVKTGCGSISPSFGAAG